jgi:hypothetical protein
MPIALTTAKATGDLDPDAPGSEYAQAKITHFGINIEGRAISIRVEYGNTVSSVWQPGILLPNFVSIDGADYDTLIAETPPNTTSSIYVHAANSLYQWLIANLAQYDGTIV